MNSCHNCRFYLENEPAPNARCLEFYNQAIAVEQLKKGLIGECDRYISVKMHITPEWLKNKIETTEEGEIEARGANNEHTR